MAHVHLLAGLTKLTVLRLPLRLSVSIEGDEKRDGVELESSAAALGVSNEDILDTVARGSRLLDHAPAAGWQWIVSANRV